MVPPSLWTRMGMRSPCTESAGMGSTPGEPLLSARSQPYVSCQQLLPLLVINNLACSEWAFCRFTAPANLREGTTSETQDLSQIIFRMKMLGFNAIRLPMTFDNHWGLGQVSIRQVALVSCSALWLEG